MRRTQEIAAVLRTRIAVGIHFGTIHPAARLPSIRQIATEFAVDQRTALAAYGILEREGVVERRSRSGIYLALQSTPVTRAAATRGLLEAFIAGFGQGVRPADLPKVLDRCLNGSRVAVVIEDTRDHLVAIRTELADGYRMRSLPLDIEEMESPSGIATLNEADVIVTTSFHLARVRNSPAARDKPVFLMTLHDDVASRVRHAMKHDDVYVVAVDPRLEKRAQLIAEAWGRSRGVRVLIVGRDDLGRIPSAAPVFVSRAAKDALAPGDPLRNAAVLSYEFPELVARDVLRYVIAPFDGMRESSTERATGSAARTRSTSS